MEQIYKALKQSKEKKSMKIHVGQRYKSPEGNEYLLCSIFGVVGLVSLVNGLSLNGAIHVNDVMRITFEQFKEITSSRNFTLIQ